MKHIGPLTSANRTGEKPAQTAEEVVRQLGSEIDLILDGGPTLVGQPSTVLQIEPKFRILRQGAISRHRLQQVLSSASIQLSEEHHN